MHLISSTFLGYASPRRMLITCANSRISEVREVPEGLSTPDAIAFPEGALLIPGLHDAHLHLLEGGLRLEQLDLFGVRSVEKFSERLDTFVRSREWKPGD